MGYPVVGKLAKSYCAGSLEDLLGFTANPGRVLPVLFYAPAGEFV